MVVSYALPAINRSGGAILLGGKVMDERIKTQISIIYVAYHDTDYDVLTWVKNVGELPITKIENCEVFFGKAGNVTRIPRGTGDGEWSYQVEGGGDWVPKAQ